MHLLKQAILFAGLIAASSALAYGPNQNVWVSNAMQTSLSIAWTAQNQAKSYYIAFTNGGSPPDCRQGGEVQNTSFVHDGLVPGSLYSVSVCSMDYSGNFYQIGTVSEYTPQSAAWVSTPRNVSIYSPVSGTLQINWQNGDQSNSVTGYWVSFSATATPANCGGVDVRNTQHIREGLSPAVNYTVTVCAHDAAGNISQPTYASLTPNGQGSGPRPGPQPGPGPQPWPQPGPGPGPGPQPWPQPGPGPGPGPQWPNPGQTYTNMSFRCQATNATYASLENVARMSLQGNNGDYRTVDVVTTFRLASCQKITTRLEQSCSPGRACTVLHCEPDNSTYANLENTLYSIYIDAYAQVRVTKADHFDRQAACTQVSGE